MEYPLVNHLRDFRKQAGFTQQDLAYKARVALRTVSYIESHPGCKPWHTTKQRLLRALGLSFADRELVFPTAPVERAPLPCGCRDTVRTMATMVREGRHGYGHYAQDGDFMGPCEPATEA